MFALMEIEIVINGKGRKDSFEADLNTTANLKNFKKYLLSEAKLSASESDKYLLSYLSTIYTLPGDGGVLPFHIPLLCDSDLRQYIYTTVTQDRKLTFRLEKNNATD